MPSNIIVVFCFLFSLPSVLCNAGEYVDMYNYVLNQVINSAAIQKKIGNSLPDTDEAKMVALQMFDASTQVPSGLLQGNFFDLGNFDECYGIHYEDIYGKYCLGTLELGSLPLKFFDVLNIPKTRFTVDLHPQPRIVAGTSTGFHFATCVPSNWSTSDIPGLLKYTDDLCYSKATEPELSAGAIATIVILSLFLGLLVASTAFDIFLYYTKRDPPHELLISFSVLTNGRKIFKSTTNTDQLLCLNGIKAISMMWVVIAHEYSLAINAPISNLSDILNWMNDSATMFIQGGSVSVDTFFVVGGLVTVYTFLRSMDKGVKFNVILYYLHRYLRLTPALGIMCLIHLYLTNYFSYGPIWQSAYTTLSKPCEDKVWSTFLYITNYVVTDNCVPQSWYLSVDMQLYILSPIILIPLWKWPKYGLGALGSLIVAGCVIPFAIGYSENLKTMLTGDQVKYMKVYYKQTYARFGPYVIGMLLGYLLYKLKKSERRFKIPMWAICISWLVCLTGLTACVYAEYPLVVSTIEDKWGHSMFIAFDRPAWAVALSGVIFLCVAGFGGPIDKFLSLPIFQFLTKLSYSMYLVHYAVITIRYSAMKTLFRFSDVTVMLAFWEDFVLTLALSLLLCLSFESPIIILEKYIFGRGPPKRVREEKKPEV